MEEKKVKWGETHDLAVLLSGFQVRQSVFYSHENLLNFRNICSHNSENIQYNG